MAEFRITAIEFDPQALIVSYVQIPDDVRVSGRVVHQHQLQMRLDHPDYAEDTDLLHRTAVRVLQNALEDWTNSEPFNPEDHEDDDERGMGE